MIGHALNVLEETVIFATFCSNNVSCKKEYTLPVLTLSLFSQEAQVPLLQVRVVFSWNFCLSLRDFSSRSSAFWRENDLCGDQNSHGHNFRFLRRFRRHKPLLQCVKNNHTRSRPSKGNEVSLRVQCKVCSLAIRSPLPGPDDRSRSVRKILSSERNMLLEERVFLSKMAKIKTFLV